MARRLLPPRPFRGAHGPAGDGDRPELRQRDHTFTSARLGLNVRLRPGTLGAPLPDRVRVQGAPKAGLLHVVVHGSMRPVGDDPPRLHDGRITGARLTPHGARVNTSASPMNATRSSEPAEACRSSTRQPCRCAASWSRLERVDRDRIRRHSAHVTHRVLRPVGGEEPAHTVAEAGEVVPPYRPGDRECEHSPPAA